MFRISLGFDREWPKAGQKGRDFVVSAKPRVQISNLAQVCRMVLAPKFVIYFFNLRLHVQCLLRVVPGQLQRLILALPV